MTNIVEIVNSLNKDNVEIDMVISNGHIFVVHSSKHYEVTTMRFVDQIRLIAHLLNDNIFG